MKMQFYKYFRPKIPKQYRNERFIPKDCRLYNNSNVPVPIFLFYKKLREKQSSWDLEGLKY